MQMLECANWKTAIIFPPLATHQSKYVKSIPSADSSKQNQFWKVNKFIISIAINQKYRTECFFHAFSEFIDSAFLHSKSTGNLRQNVSECLDPAIVYTIKSDGLSIFRFS